MFGLTILRDNQCPLTTNSQIKNPNSVAKTAKPNPFWPGLSRLAQHRTSTNRFTKNHGAFGSYVVFFFRSFLNKNNCIICLGVVFFNWLQVAVTRKQPFNSRGVLDPKINRTNPSVFAQTSCAKRFTNWDDCSWRPRVSETMVQRSLKKRSFGKNQGMVFDLQGNLKKTKTHTHIKNK